MNLPTLICHISFLQLAKSKLLNDFPTFSQKRFSKLNKRWEKHWSLLLCCFICNFDRNRKLREIHREVEQNCEHFLFMLWQQIRWKDLFYISTDELNVYWCAFFGFFSQVFENLWEMLFSFDAIHMTMVEFCFGFLCACLLLSSCNLDAPYYNQPYNMNKCDVLREKHQWEERNGEWEDDRNWQRGERLEGRRWSRVV